MLHLLADRIGAHPRRTLAGAFVFFVLAAILGGPIFGALDTENDFADQQSESFRAIERIQAATGETAGAAVLLIADLRAPATSAAGRAQIRGLARELAAIDGIATVIDADSTPDPALISRDGLRTSIAATIAGRAEEDAVVAAVLERFEGRPGIIVGGPAVADEQLGEQISKDLGRAETLAFPLLVLLSLIFFRGARAAFMPLAVGLVTVLGTFMALRAVNELHALSIFALNLVIGLGLGLAIDYTLLLLTRFREEMAVHGAGPVALARTMRTAGLTVAFSAGTVAIALITLTMFPLNFLQSMGIGGALVAIIAALAALVITPAFLALWGAKLTPRGRDAEQAAAAGRWHRLATAVMRRPGLVAAVTILVMVALSLPALRATWTPVDSTAIPQSLSSRVVADTLATEFPRDDSSPIRVAISGPGTVDPAQVRQVARAIAAVPQVRTVGDPQRLTARLWQLEVTARGRAADATARAAVERIRELQTPLRLQVAGQAAAFLDQQAAIGSRLPAAVAALALLTFVVLWLMTGSVILPLKALVMNTLTVGVALGVLTLIFQDGRLEGLLGYTSNGGIEPTDFLITAALVFALSTDYGVFLLGRIKEARDAGASERDAVVLGVSRTGAVVTAAAILLAVAVGAFSTSAVVFIKQIGIGAAIGVLVDALIVRALLVPSLMALLGRWNWWSPAPLRRLHDRIGLSEA